MFECAVTGYSAYLHRALGLVRKSTQTTDGVTYSFDNPGSPGNGYTYNAAGLPATVWYPSGRMVSYGYDSAGRATTVGGYVTSVSYYPHGAVSSLSLGNGVVENALYNNRLQLSSMEAVKSGSSLWKLENFYCPSQGGSCTSNNGNVVSQRLNANNGALVLTTAYGYDGVNRISSAGETGAGTPWSLGFNYSGQHGNLTQTGDVQAPLLVCGSYSTATNRCTDAGFGYNATGDLTTYQGRTLEYDAENRQKTLVDSGITYTYSYDGEGRRVKKAGAGNTTILVYDAFGRLAAEYATAPPSAPCATCYVTADHLGSTRLVTDSAGAVTRRYDYYPFGQEIGSGLGNRTTVPGFVPSDTFNPKFTGKPRDYESGLQLDYFGARYFSGAQGRFTSPDPLLNSGRPWEPQSWNRYAYTLNNPLRYTDPLGLYEWDKNCKQGDQTCEQNRQQFRDALANFQKSASNLAAGSKERKQLDTIIAKIGTEGDGNKTRIAFNAKMADFGQTFGNKMTFNFQVVDQSLSKWDAATVSTAKAALVGHEGQHLVDGGGMFSGLMYRMSGSERVRQEIGPHMVESYVFQGFNKLEPFGYGLGVSKGDTAGWPLWNPSWVAADADKLRQTNVRKVVEENYNKKK